MKRPLTSMIGKSLLACIGVSPAVNASADNANWPTYGPPLGAVVVHPLPMQPCETTGSGLVIDNDEALFARCPKGDLRLQGMARPSRRESDRPESTHVRITLTAADTRKFQAILPMVDFPPYFIDAVHSADLNGDGQADFAIDLSSHGNGLAAERGGKLFILSAGQGYRYVSLKDVMQDSRLVQFAGQKAATLALQRMVTTGTTSAAVRAKDHKQHTFFLFDLIAFDATAIPGITLANATDARFPFFTLFTDKPSATETSLLSALAKRQLWQNPVTHSASGRLSAR